VGGEGGGGEWLEGCVGLIDMGWGWGAMVRIDGTCVTQGILEGCWQFMYIKCRCSEANTCLAITHDFRSISLGLSDFDIDM
jgi:hypothetical protein